MGGTFETISCWLLFDQKSAILQDMAVETLLKICHKCKRKFAVLQPMEQQPFVAELLVSLSDVIKDLKVHQVNMFYESVALMIRAEGHQPTRDSYLVRATFEQCFVCWYQVLCREEEL